MYQPGQPTTDGPRRFGKTTLPIAAVMHIMKPIMPTAMAITCRADTSLSIVRQLQHEEQFVCVFVFVFVFVCVCVCVCVQG